MSENLRGFTGWWIPVELIEVYKLDWPVAMLWAEINALSKREAGCTAGNDHFARHLGVTERRIQQMMAVLKANDLIEQKSFDGRVRTLACKPIRGEAPSAAEVKSISGQGGNALQGRVEMRGKFPIDARASERKVENKVEEGTPVIPSAGDLPSRRRKLAVVPSPEAKEVVRVFAGIYGQRFGRAYVPDARQDGAAAAGLVAAGVTAEEVGRVFEAATRCKGWRASKTTTLPMLARFWNEVGAEIAQGANGKSSSDNGQTADEWAAELRNLPTPMRGDA
jgi:hypothetical protein